MNVILLTIIDKMNVNNPIRNIIFRIAEFELSKEILEQDRVQIGNKLCAELYTAFSDRLYLQLKQRLSIRMHNDIRSIIEDKYES